MSNETNNQGTAVGSTIGGGTVNAQYIAGGDINIQQHFPDAPAYKLPPLPPQGKLPKPSNLMYPGSRTVHHRNPQFTGREKELRDLADVLVYANGHNAAARKLACDWCVRPLRAAC